MSNPNEAAKNTNNDDAELSPEDMKKVAGGGGQMSYGATGGQSAMGSFEEVEEVEEVNSMNSTGSMSDTSSTGGVTDGTDRFSGS